MKTVVYTCITGGYDSLKEPNIVSKDVDYICFTDNLNLKSPVWQIKPIPEELKFLSNVKKQRIVKICPHRYLSEYDVSVWVDGHIYIIGDINEFISQYDLNKCSFYTRVHPSRKCIYDEAEAVIKMNKDSIDVVNRQIQRYKQENYPKKIGMMETGIILRKHNAKICKLLCNLWASELLKESHRDQLSFNYACWKMKFVAGVLTNETNINSNKFFRIGYHG